MDASQIPVEILLRSFLQEMARRSISTVVVYSSIERGRASMHAASNTGPEGVQAALAILNKAGELPAIEAVAEVLYTFEETARLGLDAIPWSDAHAAIKIETRKLAAAALTAAHAAIAQAIVDKGPQRSGLIV